MCCQQNKQTNPCEVEVWCEVKEPSREEPHYQLQATRRKKGRSYFVVAVVFVLSCWMFCFALLWTGSHLYLNLISDM